MEMEMFASKNLITTRHFKIGTLRNDNNINNYNILVLQYRNMFITIKYDIHS